MKKDAYLVIVTTQGDITIPFLGIEEVDTFTVQYDKQKDLVENLFKMLDIKVPLDKVRDVYIFKEHYSKKDENTYIRNYPVKYSGDNFNKDDIFYAFSSYLKDDPRRIRRTDVQYVKHDALMDYLAGERGITDFDIERAVSSYLKKQGYSVYRDIYFLIKNHNIYSDDTIYNIRIDKVDERKRTGNKDRISSFQTKDPYFSYLQEYAKKGEEEYDKAMDMIASYSLEELRNLKSNLGQGIVDGINDDLMLTQEDIYMLEELTGISLDTLIERINSRNKKGNGRR